MTSILIRLSAALALAAGLAGCYPYDPYYPYGYASPQVAFDRYFGAAAGAMRDAGVQVTSEDRTTGVITGVRGGATMNAKVITQADGRVRVEFNAGGKLSEDPGLPDRVNQAYEARVGR